MIELVIPLLAAYFGMLLLLNLLLKGKASVGLLGWFSVSFVRLRMHRFRADIGQISIRLRVSALWRRSSEDGSPESLFVIKITNVNVTTLSPGPSKDHRPKSTGKKSLAQLAKLVRLLPIDFSIKDISIDGNDTHLRTDKLRLYFNIDQIWEEGAKAYATYMRAELSDVHINSTQCVQNAKLIIHGDVGGTEKLIENVVISVVFNHLLVDTSSLSRLRHEWKGDQTTHIDNNTIDFTALAGAIDIASIGFSTNRLVVLHREINYSLRDFYTSLRKIDRDDLNLRTYVGNTLHKLSMGTSTMQVTPEYLKDTQVQIEFISFSQLIDIEFAVAIIEHLDEEGIFCRLPKVDASMFRSYLTITNATTLTTLDDLLTVHQKEYGTKKSTNQLSPIVKKNLFTLCRSVRVKFQLLFAYLHLRIEDGLETIVMTDDIRIGLLTDESSIFNKNPRIGLNTQKPVNLNSRGINLTIKYKERTVRVLELQQLYFYALVELSSDSWLWARQVKCGFQSIEGLFEDVEVVKVLQRVWAQKGTQFLMKRVSTGLVLKHQEQKMGVLDRVGRFTFELEKAKIAACFTNPVKYFAGQDQSELNKFKRGFSLHLSRCRVYYDKKVSKLLKYQVDHISVYLIRDYDTERKAKRLCRFVESADITGMINQETNAAMIAIPEIYLHISIEIIWSVLFVKTIFESALPARVARPAKTKSPLSFAVTLGLLAIKFELPGDSRFAVELDTFKYAEGTARFTALRLYVTNYLNKNVWNPLLVFTYGLIQVGTITTVQLESAKAEVPFEYKVYELFDNVKAFAKSIKQIRVNFKELPNVEENDKNFKLDIIYPKKVEKPFKCPPVQVRAKRFKFCMHDDPFEVQLSRCFNLGRLEQRSRIAKYGIFDKYVGSLEAKLQEKYNLLKFEKGIALKPNEEEELNRETTVERDAQYKSFLKEYHELVEIPRSKLFANISKAWILRVQNCDRMMRIPAESQTKDPPVRNSFLNRFPVVVPEVAATELFSINFTDLLVNLDEPSYGIENYAEHFNKVGDGMPLDQEYSILIPVHMDLLCKAFEISLKDYALPLLCMGDPTDDNRLVEFSGNIAVIEQMFTPDEIRYNFVPYVSQYHDPNKADSFYASHIARTMTDLKFIVDLTAQIKSPNATIISWSCSIQPALLYAMDMFDVLSKPPLDRSGPLGWWDKVPLLFHGHFNAHMSSGLHLFIKSGQSPYDYFGRDVGFLFKWADYTRIELNGNGPSTNMLEVESDSFEICVPSFHYKSPDELISGFSSNSRNYTIKKITLALRANPVIWTIGFMFERNAELDATGDPGYVPRTTKFIPHYQVKLKNPATFKTKDEEKKHDSFAGWRSQYIHMAISVRSKGDDANNALHFSPLASDHFMRWWNTFHNSLGLPIKQGDMFDHMRDVHKKHVSFGSLLYSISYQLNVQPAFLAHASRSTIGLQADSKVSFTALKCHVSDFQVDLHQTKTGEFIYDKDGNEIGRNFSLKMLKGMVDIGAVDLRIVVAEFNQTSTSALAAREFGITNSDSQSHSDLDDSSEEQLPTGWYNGDDFVELDNPPLEGDPRCKVYSFVTAPRVYYVHDLGFSHFLYPFSHIQVRTHHCMIGKRDVIKDVSNIAQLRAAKLRSQIEEKQLISEKDPSLTKSVQAHITELKRRLDTMDSIEAKLSNDTFPEWNEFLYSSKTESEDGKSLSRCVTTTSRFTSSSHRMSISEKTGTYRNKFIIYNMDMTDSPRIRDLIFDYLERVDDLKSMKFSTSHRAITLAETLSTMIQKRTEGLKNDISWKQQLNNAADLMDHFDEELHDTSLNYKAQDTFLFRFLLPQIRISSNNDDQAIILIASEMDIKETGIIEPAMIAEADEDVALVETRDGIIISDAFLYVMEKEEALKDAYKLYTPDKPLWPPIVPCELYYMPDVLEKCTVVRNFSAGSMMTRPNVLHFTKGHNEYPTKTLAQNFQIVMPALHIVANSEQFGTIFDTVLDLIRYEKSDSQKTKEAVKKVVKFTDTDNLQVIMREIEQLQQLARQVIIHNEFAEIIDEEKYKSEHLQLSVELEKVYLKLNALVNYLQEIKVTRYNDSYDSRRIGLTAFEIELELTDDGLPFLVLNATDTFFSTVQSPNGASQNLVCIFDFFALDTSPDARYKVVCSRYENEKGKKTEPLTDDKKPMCLVDWSLIEPVGGISVMDHRKINFAPIRLQVDQLLASKVYKFIFPDSSVRVSEEIYEGEDDDVDQRIFETDTDSISDSIMSSPDSVESSTMSAMVPVSSNTSSTRRSGLSRIKSLKSSSMNRTQSEVSVVSYGTMSHRDGPDLGEMDRRASLYVMGNMVSLEPTKICLTFRGKGSLKAIDVTDMVIQVPRIEFNNMTLSSEEFFTLLRVKVLRIVMKNIPGFIHSKFRRGKKEDKSDSDKYQRRELAWSINPFSKKPTLGHRSGSMRKLFESTNNS